MTHGSVQTVHYEIDYDEYDFCPKCGQRIDRSELE